MEISRPKKKRGSASVTEGDTGGDDSKPGDAGGDDRKYNIILAI